MSAIRLPPEKNRRYGTSFPATPAVVMLNHPSALAVLVPDCSGADILATDPESAVTWSLTEQSPVWNLELEMLAVPVPEVLLTNGTMEPSKLVAATTVVPASVLVGVAVLGLHVTALAACDEANIRPPDSITPTAPAVPSFFNLLIWLSSLSCLCLVTGRGAGYGPAAGRAVQERNAITAAG